MPAYELLGLQQFYNNLKDFSANSTTHLCIFYQDQIDGKYTIHEQGNFLEAGQLTNGPVELKWELPHVNCQDISGMAEPIDKLSPHSTYTEYIASLLGFLIRPVDYPHYICPVQPGRIALLGNPHSHKQSKDSSTANFEASSSSLSLSKAELLKQHGQDQVDNQGLSTEGLPLPVMSPEDFLTNANMKLLSTKDQQFSWIGSEEDREDRPEGIIHAVSLSKMVHQNQADNFQHVNRNRLPMTKFDRPKYPDSVGFNTPGLITLDAVSEGRSSSIDQTHVMSSLTQMTSYVPASTAG